VEKYQEAYSASRLRRWKQQVEEWAKDLAAIYIYFDNDQAGYAARNALTLKGLLTEESTLRPVETKPKAAGEGARATA
jgi:uncharacterized protein YecE (DUF72 family)